MEIHAPTGPAHSFKDFAVHILIVTISILIALGLEGTREVWKENKAVTEARRSLQEERGQGLDGMSASHLFDHRSRAGKGCATSKAC